MRELTQSCQEVSDYPSSIKCPILHAAIADQDNKCQESSGVRNEHIPAIHEEGDVKDVQLEYRTGYFQVHTHCGR